MKNLMRLISTHPDPVHATAAWRHRACGTILCPKCNKVDRSRFPEPRNVVFVERPDHRITGAVWWTGIRIFHRRFIDQIREHLSGYAIGKCLDPEDKMIEEYATCYSKNYIVLRGTKQSKYRICDTCGTVGSIGWHAPPYILRSYLTDSLVYQDTSCFMFLDEDLALQLDFSSWPDAQLEPIAIRAEPIDGQHLPSNPSAVLSR